jgi:hypothetical protein
MHFLSRVSGYIFGDHISNDALQMYALEEIFHDCKNKWLDHSLRTDF